MAADQVLSFCRNREIEKPLAGPKPDLFQRCGKPGAPAEVIFVGACNARFEGKSAAYIQLAIGIYNAR
jgi:hypothetical protein